MTDNATVPEGWRQLIANLINAAETVGYWDNAKDAMPTEYRAALEVETVAAAALEKYIADGFMSCRLTAAQRPSARPRT
jgi:hypothetical protein